MLCLRYCGIVFILLFWSIVDAHSPSPSDVRIDHHKAQTTHDLVINTPRPRFSWKICISDNKSQRNVQQTAYQMQLQSIKLTQRDQPFLWDTGRVVSSQSIHVPYTGQNDLLSSTYYHFRVRVWTTNSDEASEWTNWIQFRTPIFNLHKYLTENSTALWIGSRKINMNELRKEFMVSNTSPVKSAIVYKELYQLVRHGLCSQLDARLQELSNATEYLDSINMAWSRTVKFIDGCSFPWI